MLSKVHHIGIAVRSADEALTFYRDLLGLPVTKDAVLTEQGIRGVLLSAGETELELLEPLRPDTPVGRFLDSRGQGMHHLCFATDDINAELEKARGSGLRLIDQTPRPGLAGMIAFVHPSATRGVLVEFAQPPDAPPVAHVQPEGGIGVTSFDHLAVAVTDLEAGAETFRRNFDLVESGRAVLDSLGIRRASLPIGGAVIEVITPLSDHAPQARFLRERGEGMYLLSLAVHDLDGAIQLVHRHGVRTGEPVSPRPGTRFLMLSPRSTHGVLLQLTERGEPSHTSG